LDRACRIQAIRTADRQSSPDALYFINFIPSGIYVAELCLETTFKALKERRISPSRIVFKVTEPEFVRDLDHLKSILRYYRSHGLRYALDDVGEGHNTLDTLRYLEPDIVKLDRKWVSHVDQDPKKRDVALETLETARNVGATALAEGVERAEEAEVLKAMGYLWQQGYLYGKASEIPQTP
jgi:EAL domain-containing protein (putative c-di-GMP-specific phosphodiesterase class I)